MDKMTVKDVICAADGEVCLFDVKEKKSVYKCDVKKYSDESAAFKEFLEMEIADITDDSRKIKNGAVFAAIKGERVDGHSLIGEVFEKGAVIAVGDQDISDENIFFRDSKYPFLMYIKTSSTVEALGRLAGEYMKIQSIPVVAITGSAGKTTTKEAVASVLSERYKTGKTSGNNNNLIGLPLTCFSFDSNTEIGVCEMGISAPGEMDRLVKMAPPELAVFTNIGTGHLEHLKTREGVFLEKSKLAAALKPDGAVVLNIDDDMLKSFGGKEAENKEVIKYCLKNTSDINGDVVYASDIVDDGLNGTDFKIKNLNIGGERKEIKTHICVPGIHMVYAALAAACVGAHFGLMAEEIDKGIRSIKPVEGRAYIIKKDDGTIIIDDSYNANPESVKAGIDMLCLGKGRKIVIFGDMGELGDSAPSYHKQIGEYIRGKDIAALFTVGDLAANAAQELAEDSDVYVESFKNKDDAVRAVKNYVKSGDNILVKASNFMKFKEIVDELSK